MMLAQNHDNHVFAEGAKQASTNVNKSLLKIECVLGSMEFWESMAKYNVRLEGASTII